MTYKKSNISISTILLLISSINCVALSFQENPPEPVKAPGPPPPGLVVSIDSGIIYLLLMGIALGIVILRMRKG